MVLDIMMRRLHVIAGILVLLSILAVAVAFLTCMRLIAMRLGNATEHANYVSALNMGCI
jgi:hypothetical protein